jgi:hypothetical protein
MNVGLQSAFDLGWAALASATTQWSIVIRQVDALGQPLPDREWRTPFMDQTVLNFVMPGNWTWTNGGSLDLASYLVVGDVAQVQLVSRDASGSLRGASAPVFVRLGL